MGCFIVQQDQVTPFFLQVECQELRNEKYKSDIKTKLKKYNHLLPVVEEKPLVWWSLFEVRCWSSTVFFTTRFFHFFLCTLREEIDLEFIVILGVPMKMPANTLKFKRTRNVQEEYRSTLTSSIFCEIYDGRLHLDELLIHSGYVPKFVESEGRNRWKRRTWLLNSNSWVSKNPDEELKSANMDLPFLSNCSIPQNVEQTSTKYWVWNSFSATFPVYLIIFRPL